MPLVLQRTPRKLTLRERLLVLWVIKQKLIQQKEGKCSAIDTSAMKGMFEDLFFGTNRSLATLRGHSGGVLRLALYGNKLFSAGGSGGGYHDSTIRVWNADTHEHLATLEGHSGGVLCLTLYGNKLFSGAAHRNIRVWNVEED